jgi:hypothetical protein
VGEQKHKDAQGKEWDMKVSKCRVLVMSFTLTCCARGPRCLPLRIREEFQEGLSHAEVRAHEQQWPSCAYHAETGTDQAG